jgi:hypothetical protein
LLASELRIPAVIIHKKADRLATWSSGMPKDRSTRQTPSWRELFAERQIYLRSGEGSRYVVLSRSLQLGVAIGMLVLIGSLALASYGYLSSRFQAVGQDGGRDGALATDAGQQLRQEVEALRAEVDELTSAAQAREEEIARLSRELADSEAEVERLNAALSDGGVPSAGSNDDLAARQLADIKGGAEMSADEVLELKQDLAGAQATIAGLTADLAAAGAPPGEARRSVRDSTGAAPGGPIAEIEKKLLLGEARIAELESRLAVLVARLAPLPPPQAPRGAGRQP